MKKTASGVLALLLSILTVFSVSACGGGGDTPVTTDPVTTEVPVTEPPAPTEPPEVTKSITIGLPTDRTEEYSLSIWFEDEMVVHVQLTPDTATYEFSLTGTGSGTYEIWIDDELLRTEKVDFNA